MSVDPNYVCRVCGADSRRASFDASETMFGKGGTFAYDQCLACESLQMRRPLNEGELSPYYSGDYYSFETGRAGRVGFVKRVKTEVKKIVRRSAYDGSVLGKAVDFVHPETSVLKVMSALGVRREQRILDVGCGAGHFLDQLAHIGFRNLTGVDPFLSQDLVSGCGVNFYKRHLDQVIGPFDIIIFNHSLEHVQDPAAELSKTWQRLTPGGLCLVQTPTPMSEAFENYGVKWAQWDAPRHITLISRKGAGDLAARCGFRLTDVIDLALPWSLMASELCRRGVPFAGVDWSDHFSATERRDFRRKATMSNRRRRGDTVSYVLTRQ